MAFARAAGEAVEWQNRLLSNRSRGMSGAPPIGPAWLHGHSELARMLSTSTLHANPSEVSQHFHNLPMKNTTGRGPIIVWVFSAGNKQHQAADVPDVCSRSGRWGRSPGYPASPETSASSPVSPRKQQTELQMFTRPPFPQPVPGAQ